MEKEMSTTPTDPKISVITVCYNAAKVLPLTIESVLAQDPGCFEYIIQDGASADETPDIVESYREKFASKGISYRYISEPDEGIYDAMNRAVRSARGSYINFMNAGDCFYDSDVLGRVSDVIDSAGSSGPDRALLGIIYGDCVVYEFGRFFKYQKAPERISEMMPFSHQSVFAKRDLLAAHPFNTKYRLCADYDFLLTMHDLGAGFSDTGTVICITTADGVSSVRYRDTLMETARIRKAHGVLHQTKGQLIVTGMTLCIKQFVLDHFPDAVKKGIRDRQIRSRGQNFTPLLPPWFHDSLPQGRHMWYDKG